MSSGKTHSAIGFITAGVVGTALVKSSGGATDYSILAPILVGSIVGSLMPDIDSKRSKASQMFTKTVVALAWVYFLGDLAVSHIPSLSQKIGVSSNVINMGADLVSMSSTRFLNYLFSFTTSSLGMMLMAILITLGKLSPHRQFTHRIIGTACFVGVAWIAFSTYFALGFSIGYAMHIIADKFTPAGLDFFEIRLPMQNSKGEFHPVI